MILLRLTGAEVAEFNRLRRDALASLAILSRWVDDVLEDWQGQADESLLRASSLADIDSESTRWVESSGARATEKRIALLLAYRDSLKIGDIDPESLK
jgi:hypothetical protein